MSIKTLVKTMIKIRAESPIPVSLYRPGYTQFWQEIYIQLTHKI